MKTNWNDVRSMFRSVLSEQSVFNKCQLRFIIGESHVIWFTLLNDTGRWRLNSRRTETCRWSSQGETGEPTSFHGSPRHGPPLFPLCSLSLRANLAIVLHQLWNVLCCCLSHMFVTEPWDPQEKGTILPLFFLRTCPYIPNQQAVVIMCSHHTSPWKVQ